MTRTKKLSCIKHRCDAPPHLGGLCKEHFAQEELERRACQEALDALNRSVVDGALLANIELREKLTGLQKWWRRACDSINYGRLDPVLRDEAEFACEWFISLAKEIVAAERALKAGKQPSGMLEYTSNQVFTRLSNLENGLMSNGVKRVS